MYSWPPKYPPYQQQNYFPTTYTQPLDPLHFYELVPLEQAPKPRQTSPQMQIYDETNPNQFINQSEGNILRDFKKFLEQNPDKISKLSTSNIKISYKILNGNNLSLSFDFIDSDKENQNHNLTFINGKDTKLVATKSNSILKMEETTKRETEDKAKKEAEERAKREEERAKKEAEDRAKREEERAKKEAEDRAKLEAEVKAKQLRQLFNRISSEVAEIEESLGKLTKKTTHNWADGIPEEKKMPMMKEIESEIKKITSTLPKSSALDLIESSDHKQSPSAIASINKSTFDCVRSSQKENNFYKILTENGEAKQLLIAYLAEYDDGEKSKKLTSLVELITEKNKSYEKTQSPSTDKAKIMEDLIIDLGTKILANRDMVALQLEGANRAIAESNESEDREQEEKLNQLKPALTSKLSKTTEKLTDFLKKTGNTEDSLKKMIAERSPDSQFNANSADNLSATQANARSL